MKPGGDGIERTLDGEEVIGTMNIAHNWFEIRSVPVCDRAEPVA
jgi:hypothetical protein